MSYLNFLFDSEGNVIPRNAPKVSYIPGTGSYKLAYSIPGYHTPRQYFTFVSIPDKFPNSYLSDIFYYFSITNSFLYSLRKKAKIPNPKKALVSKALNVYSKPIHTISDEERSIAIYNINLSIYLGKKNHSMFYFNSYLNSYKTLHPELHYSKSTVDRLYNKFNKLISVPSS